MPLAADVIAVRCGRFLPALRFVNLGSESKRVCAAEGRQLPGRARVCLAGWGGKASLNKHVQPAVLAAMGKPA